MSQEDTQAFVQQLADQLGEHEAMPQQLLTAIVERCGQEFCQQILQQTIEVEAQGGLMIKNGSRRRTFGGVFFYLARAKMPYRLRKTIFGIQDNQSQAAKPTSPELPPFHWKERRAVIEPLLAEQGEISTVKITLIGRPGRIDVRKDVVITTLSHVLKSPTLPKGVPKPPETPTLYTVYIGSKQWRRVEEAIKAPDDALIIEGTCTFDAEVGGMAVFATNVTTKKLEMQKREQQKQQAGAPASPAAAPPPSPAPARVREREPEPEFELPAAPAYIPPSGMPSEAAQKLTELHAAATLYRQKIAVLQAKPAGQQFGLEMTQKLLTKTEQEINALETKYAQ